MKFGEDYYLRGRELGISLYENYSWHPEMTEPMAQAIVDTLKPGWGDVILDYGCARGYLVRALRAQGRMAWGVDVSTWAVGPGADREAKTFLSPFLRHATYDWLIAKDVFEHVPDIGALLVMLGPRVLKGALIIVPLTEIDGGAYIEPDEEKDTTHCIRLTAGSWLDLFRGAWPIWGWDVRSHIPGIKNHRANSTGYGFFVGRA